jgi:hypothetical protein
MLDAAAARESGFGTGLLAHLERGRVPEEPAPEPVAPPEPEARAPEPEQIDPLAERERILAVREAAVEAARAELAAREAQLAAYEASPGEPASVPGELRAQAERSADRVWSAFGAALEATHPHGRPHHATRIAAAQALLAELRLDPPGAAFADELARRRELREATR